jgi:hypothetical protein
VAVLLLGSCSSFPPRALVNERAMDDRQSKSVRLSEIPHPCDDTTEEARFDYARKLAMRGFNLRFLAHEAEDPARRAEFEAASTRCIIGALLHAREIHGVRPDLWWARTLGFPDSQAPAVAEALWSLAYGLSLSGRPAERLDAAMMMKGDPEKVLRQPVRRLLDVDRFRDGEKFVRVAPEMATDPRPGPDLKAEERDLLALLADAVIVAGWSERAREVEAIEAILVGADDAESIAEALGVTRNNAYQILSRIRGKAPELKRALLGRKSGGNL